jgi:hypothetical protein
MPVSKKKRGCKEMKAYIACLENGQIGGRHAKAFNNHMKRCTTCRERLDQIKQVWDWLDALPVIEPSSDFKARFWMRVHAAKSQESK